MNGCPHAQQTKWKVFGIARSGRAGLMLIVFGLDRLSCGGLF